MLKESAKAILAEKDAEIQRLNREIDEAERLLNEGYKQGTDEDAQVRADIAKLENELNHFEVRAQAQLQALKETHDEEIRDLKKKHAREMEDLDKQMARATKYVPPKPKFEPEPTEEPEEPTEIFDNESSDELTLENAKKRLKESEKAVERLEAELRRVTNQQQQQISEQARQIRELREKKRQERVDEQRKKNDFLKKQKEAEYEAQLKDLKAELKSEEDAMEQKLRQLIERNSVLDSELAAVLADNDEKSEQLTRIKAGKSNRKASPRRTLPQECSAMTEFSVVEAEIIRLRDENEELKQILKKLDKLAYCAHPK